MAGRKKANTGSAAALQAGQTLECALNEVTERLQGLMRQTAQRSDQTEELKALADTMEKFSRASTRLLSLLRAQRELAQRDGKSAKLQQSLDVVLREWREEKK